MNTEPTKPAQEEEEDSRVRQIVDLGSSVVTNDHGTVHCLTVIGQIEGHGQAPSGTKTTKYEHVLPLLASIEESQEVDGLLRGHLAGATKPRAGHRRDDRRHDQAHGDAGIGRRPLHRHPAGGGRQADADGPLGLHDHPPHPDVRFDDRRSSDLPLFRAPAVTVSALWRLTPYHRGALPPADALQRRYGQRRGQHRL